MCLRLPGEGFCRSPRIHIEKIHVRRVESEKQGGATPGIDGWASPNLVHVLYEPTDPRMFRRITVSTLRASLE